MKIGVCGHGVIGSANAEGFRTIGHEVVVHDPKYGSEISSLAECEVVYVCVPTPSTIGGRCDTSIVSDVLRELRDIQFDGKVAIRSTCCPGFTDSAKSAFPELNISFVPEFLRERCALEDFIHNHKILIVGSDDPMAAELVVRSHGKLPEATRIVKPVEAELIKYFNNCYASTRIIFANLFYDISLRLGADYESVLEGFLCTGKSSGQYLSVNQELRGFAGACLPKDTKGLKSLVEDLGLRYTLIHSVLEDNELLEATVFPGMRG